MDPKRAVAVLFLSLIVAAAASAQERAEYGRVSDGPIELMIKHARPFSGSLSLSTNKGFGAALGGTLVADRVWFFASAEKVVSNAINAYAINGNAIDANAMSQIGSRQNLAASFGANRPPSELPAGSLFTAGVPSTFLSLHYTGIVTDNMFVTASVSNTRH